MTETTVLLGLFDGLHRGHMSAVNELLRHGGRKVVYTFDSLSLSTKGGRGLLMTDDEKRRALLNLGVDEVISRDFSDIKDVEPRDFVEKILLGELSATRAVCGENFRFGRGGQADPQVLSSICREFNIETVIVPTVCSGGEAISTTRIRRLIEQGEILEANELLGYAYGFEGEIIHGDRVGTQMGIKTVNIAFDPQRVLPKRGVYMSQVTLEGETYRGVTNVGTRPTVHDDGMVVIETHILDFHGEVYGETARVGLMRFMREEKRFGSLEELRETVANDIQLVKNYVK